MDTSPIIPYFTILLVFTCPRNYNYILMEAKFINTQNPSGMPLAWCPHTDRIPSMFHSSGEKFQFLYQGMVMVSLSIRISGTSQPF